MTIIPFVIGAFRRSLQRIIKEAGGLENNRTSGDHQNYYIVENDQNTEKSPGDLRETCCLSNSRNTDGKNSQGINNNDNNDNNYKKKENFVVPADHRKKMKESEKIDNHLNLARELKNL